MIKKIVSKLVIAIFLMSSLLFFLLVWYIGAEPTCGVRQGFAMQLFPCDYWGRVKYYWILMPAITILILLLWVTSKQFSRGKNITK